MGLLAVLIMAAVLGIVSVQVMSIYEGLHRQGSKTSAHTEANNLVRYVQDALTQPNLCDSALRTSAGGKITWANVDVANGKVPVGQIVFNGKVVAKLGQQYPPVPSKPLFRISALPAVPGGFAGIYLRRPDAANGEAVRADGKMTSAAGVGYRTVTAKLAFVFQFPNTPGGATVERTADVILALSPANQIDFCYQQAQVQAVNFKCDAGNIYPTLNCAVGGSPLCKRFYSIIGFDGFGKPKCACQYSCPVYYSGPAGSRHHHTGGHGKHTYLARNKGLPSKCPKVHPSPCPTCVLPTRVMPGGTGPEEQCYKGPGIGSILFTIGAHTVKPPLVP